MRQEVTVRVMIERGQIDDPLRRFTQQVEHGALDGHSETVNLTPLFSCHGAVAGLRACEAERDSGLRIRVANAGVLANLAARTNWRPLRPDPAFRSEIVLLRPRQGRTRRVAPDALRGAFQDQGITLTAYEDGIIRLSMPDRPWRGQDLGRIRNALLRVA